jgi:hypothetical protein
MLFRAPQSDPGQMAGCRGADRCGKAIIEHYFQHFEANLRASVTWQEAELRFMAPFKR